MNLNEGIVIARVSRSASTEPPQIRTLWNETNWVYDVANDKITSYHDR
jgi:hypothetical protein